MRRTSALAAAAALAVACQSPQPPAPALQPAPQVAPTVAPTIAPAGMQPMVSPDRIYVLPAGARLADVARLEGYPLAQLQALNPSIGRGPVPVPTRVLLPPRTTP